MWPFGRKRNAGRDSLSLIEAEAYERLCAAIGPWRAEQARKAWIPVTSESNRDEDTSYFGGTPMLNDGANWPECGACGKPAPFCMQLDSRTLPEDAPRFGDGVLQLFYCGSYECAAGDGSWEPFHPTQHLRILPHDEQRPAEPAGDVMVFPKRVIHDWDLFEDFPDPDDAVMFGLDIETDRECRTIEVRCPEMGISLTGLDAAPRASVERFERAFLRARSGDKLGGWPNWIQGNEVVTCPKCSGDMVMLFQIDSGGDLPINLGDFGCSHLWQCPTHREVLAFEWACF